MATWYRTGKVSVVNGNAAVLGAGTAWIGAVNAGDAFHGPDGRAYEIASVDGTATLTLAREYLGADQDGADYAIQPTRGVTVAFNENAQALIALVQSYVDGVLSGRFKPGTDGAPSITSAGDPDTGVSFPGGNRMRFSAGGNARAELSGSAFNIDVPITGDAVQQGPQDSTLGRLLAVGAGGLLSELPTEITDFTKAIRPGFYRFMEASATGGPEYSNYACYAIVNRTVGGGTSFFIARQTENPANQRMYYGSRTAGSGPVTWVQIYTPGTIVGSVRKEGGQPAGAIFQSGANPNGAYTRFADGSQIAWVSALHDSAVNAGQSAFGSWTFPAAFSGAPMVFPNVRSLGTQANTVAAAVRVSASASPSPSGADWAIANRSNSNLGNARLDLVAVGRWD